MRVFGTKHTKNASTGSRTADCNTPAASAPARTSTAARQRRRTIIGFVVLLVGVALLCYPYASDYLNRVEASKVSDTQQDTAQQLPKDDLSAEWAKARKYNRSIVAGDTFVTDPFDPNRPSADDKVYLSCLNIAGDGVMGQIVIPAIDADLPIYHGTNGDFMSHSVGHVVNTSLPVGGKSTHCVLAGHTGVPGAVIFDRLDQLKVGDYFVLQVLGRDLGYRVYKTEVVLPDQVQSLYVRKGRDLVSLVTCTPYGVNSHRLLIHAKRCKVPDEFYQRDAGGLPDSLTSMDPHLPPSLLQLLLALAVVLAAVFGGRKLARRRATRPRRRATRRNERRMLKRAELLQVTRKA